MVHATLHRHWRIGLWFSANCAAVCVWCSVAGMVCGAGERFDPAKLAEMDTAVESAIAEHRLPGGVLWLESRGSNYHRAYGLRAVLPRAEPMTEDTVFDVASLTKVLATAPVTLWLCERGKLDLEGAVVKTLPEFRGERKDAITLRHLLTHTSGLGRTIGSGLDWSDPRAALDQLFAATPPFPAGQEFLYSDLNFILVGEIVARAAGVPLDELARREIFVPLRMVDTGFRPSPAIRDRIAPTERARNEMLRGVVHDPKARALGGVAGHAGLFSTAADIARFARMMLNGGELDGARVLTPESVRQMTSVQTPAGLDARRGLGWDIDSDFSRPRGDLFPLGSYGMTGFTGVCLWIDPFSKSFWMFLSNRVHPDGGQDIYALQRRLATLVAEAIRDFNFRDVPGALPPRAKKRAPRRWSWVVRTTARRRRIAAARTPPRAIRSQDKA